MPPANDEKIYMPSSQQLKVDDNISLSVLAPIDQNTVTQCELNTTGIGTNKNDSPYPFSSNIDDSHSEFIFLTPPRHIVFERDDRLIQSNDEDLPNSVVAEESLEPENKDLSLYEDIVNKSNDDNDLPETDKSDPVRLFEYIFQRPDDKVKQTRVKCGEDDMAGENVDELPDAIAPRELNDGHDGLEDSFYTKWGQEKDARNAYESEIARLKIELEEKDEEIVMMKMRQLTVSAKDDVINKLQTRNDKAARHITNLTRQCEDQKRKTSIELKKLQNKLYNRDISVYKLKDGLKKAEETITALQSNLKQHGDQIKTLRADKKDLDWRLRATTKENDSLRDDVDNLKLNFKSVEAQLFEAEERMLCFQLGTQVQSRSSYSMLSTTQIVRDEWEEDTESNNSVSSALHNVNKVFEEWPIQVPNIVEQSSSEEWENSEFVTEFDMMISNVDAALQSELFDSGGILCDHDDDIKEVSVYSTSSHET